MKEQILFVDDDIDQNEILNIILSKSTYKTSFTNSPYKAIEIIKNSKIDVVVSDMEMPGMNGVELCKHIKIISPDIPVIILTGQSKTQSAFHALKSGAFDFLKKPININQLNLSLSRALKNRPTDIVVETTKDKSTNIKSSMGLIGDCCSMRNVYDLITRIGSSDASVVIHGETGTGKELIARALHQASKYSEGPFVTINCAALPSQLIESEIFGHAKGAFSDAKVARPGLFVQASEGTCFLDEIGELCLDVQAKLLRSLQERRVKPIGSDEEVCFNTRIIAATHRNLDIEVQNGRFRQDLFYRINVVKIGVPALRERGNDIVQLACYFIEKYAAKNGKKNPKLSVELKDKILNYPWPGNVRELENAIEHAIILSTSEYLIPEDLPEKIRYYRGNDSIQSKEHLSDIVTLRTLEKRYIRSVVEIFNGNKSRAAQVLGIDRRTLFHKLYK